MRYSKLTPFIPCCYPIPGKLLISYGKSYKREGQSHANAFYPYRETSIDCLEKNNVSPVGLVIVMFKSHFLGVVPQVVNKNDSTNTHIKTILNKSMNSTPIGYFTE